MFHLATHRNRWYIVSLILLIPGAISLILWGLNLGIDFTGGTIWELEFQEPVTTEQVRTVLATEGRDDATIQLSSSDNGDDTVAIIRMEEMAQISDERDRLESAMETEFGPFKELQLSTVGSSISSEISQKAVIAILAASVGILLYIAFAFRNTQNPLLYGLCAIAAMLHDIIFVLGAFSLMGHFFDVQIDALFVTAILTIIGFSVHDTIVVFDRIRENLANQTDPTFEGVVNYSLAQTLVRSVNTSMTVLFTLLALYLFGGESTRNFVLALLLGIIIGTFSSVFTASQLLVSWEEGDFRRWWNKLLRRNPAPAAA